MSASAIPPAEIEYQKEHISDDRSPQLYAICCVFLTIATASIVARFFSRRMMKANLKLDDWTAVGGLVGLYAIFIIYTIFIWRGGVGKHSILSTPAKALIASKCLYAFNVIYTLTIPLVKVSVLLLYHRIFHTQHFRWVVYFGITFMALFALSTFLVDIFTCSPIKGGWDKAVPAKCVNPPTLYRSTAIINLATDIVILCLPAPMVWRLKMSIRSRVALYGVFLLGGLVCIATALRIPTFSKIDNNDLTYTYVDVAIWTFIEVSLAVTCACLPTLRPLFRSALQRSHFSLGSRSTTTHSSTHETNKVSQGSSHEQHETRDDWQDPTSISRPEPVVKTTTPPSLLEKASDDSGMWKMRSQQNHLPLQGIQVKKDVAWVRSERPG